MDCIFKPIIITNKMIEHNEKMMSQLMKCKTRNKRERKRVYFRVNKKYNLVKLNDRYNVLLLELNFLIAYRDILINEINSNSSYLTH